MSLSRWNFSRWYIYEQDSDSLSICGDGFISLEDLNKDFDATLERFKKDESLLDFSILKTYVKQWFDAKTDKISYEEYSKKLESLRNFEYRKSYFNSGDLDNYLTAVDHHVNPNERILDVKEKTKILTIDDLEIIPIFVNKVTPKYEKYNVVCWEIKYSFKNKKNETICDSGQFYLSNLLNPEFPVLEGETYLFHKNEKFIQNKCDKIKYGQQINDHLDRITSIFLKNKVDTTSDKK